VIYAVISSLFIVKSELLNRPVNWVPYRLEIGELIPQDLQSRNSYRSQLSIGSMQGAASESLIKIGIQDRFNLS
jgi:hypothetical protein